MRVSLSDHTRKIMAAFCGSEDSSSPSPLGGNVIQDVFAALELMVVGVELVQEEEELEISPSSWDTIADWLNIWNVLHVSLFCITKT